MGAFFEFQGSYLFRVTVIDKMKYRNNTSSLYVIQPSKDRAIEYVKSSLRSNCEIKSIMNLGYELGGCMFKGGKEKK